MADTALTGDRIIREMISRHKARRDFHITRAMGVFVAVSDGKVIDYDDRLALRSCPLHALFSRSDPVTYIKEKIEEFGHFTCCRQVVRDGAAVPFGTSEMFMRALQRGMIDCAVTVSDGAGSVATENPRIVQGIGARMNGVFFTTPMPQIIDSYRKEGCIVFDDARIDQAEMVRAAALTGKKRIAVTVNACYGESYAALRALERDVGIELAIAAVCTTGIGRERAIEVISNSDIGWSCASASMRELANRAILQLTKAIPVFVYTCRGLSLLAAYADDRGRRVLEGLDLTKQYLLAPGDGEPQIAIGPGRLMLREQPLPADSRRHPEPLA